jgi:hypothetical protein
MHQPANCAPAAVESASPEAGCSSATLRSSLMAGTRTRVASTAVSTGTHGKRSSTRSGGARSDTGRGGHCGPRAYQNEQGQRQAGGCRGDECSEPRSVLALAAGAGPCNVDVPVAAALQSLLRVGRVPPEEDEDEVGDGWGQCERRERVFQKESEESVRGGGGEGDEEERGDGENEGEEGYGAEDGGDYATAGRRGVYGKPDEVADGGVGDPCG